MRNTRSGLGVVALCVGLAACGGGRDERGDETAAKDENAMHGTPTPITETGCLTAADGRYVLTDLESAAAATRENRQPPATAGAQPTTESYQLVGNEEELRAFVGKQVRVNGEADVPQVAVVRETTPPAQPQATGTSGAKVSTEAQTRLEIRKLRVSSISATGESCAAEAKTRG